MSIVSKKRPTRCSVVHSSCVQNADVAQIGPGFVWLRLSDVSAMASLARSETGAAFRRVCHGCLGNCTQSLEMTGMQNVRIRDGKSN